MTDPVAATRKTRTRTFGTVRRLPSKRWQARYLAPNGERISAPVTFETKRDADAWLAAQRSAIDSGKWKAPELGTELFGVYAERWLDEREQLKPRTRDHYRQVLDKHLLPRFESVALAAITVESVRSWHVQLGRVTGPTMRAHAYGLLRTIIGQAVSDGRLAMNPCVIRGAGSAKRVVRIAPAEDDELDVIVENMPERLRMIVLLGAWCGLRFGELAELRRKDITLDVERLRGVVQVRRGVVAVKGQRIIGDPKSDAGTRTVAVPPELVERLREHLDEHCQRGADGLLFPPVGGGTHLATRTLYDAFYPAREAAGRPDLRFHDLRHTGATRAAQAGATLADLMRRFGHSTPAAAMRYQHGSDERDRELAERLMKLDDDNVVPMRRGRRSTA